MQVSPELGNTQDSRAPGLEESEAFMVRVAGWAPSGVLHECTPPTQVGAAGITLICQHRKPRLGQARQQSHEDAQSSCL